MRNLRIGIHLLTVGCALGVIAAAGTSVARAQSGGGDEIYACVQKASKRLRIVAPGESCQPNERPLSWNAQGPEGPQGDPGPAGETGPMGPQGLAGPAGACCDQPAQEKPNSAVVGTVTVVVGSGGVPDLSFDILGHSWAEEAVIFQSGGGGPSQGIPKFKEMTLVKAIDAATPQLMGIITRGSRIDKVTVDLAPAAGAAGTILRYELSDVLLTLDQHDTSGVAGDVPLETISLDYLRIETTFTGAGGGATFCWEIAQNRAC